MRQRLAGDHVILRAMEEQDRDMLMALIREPDIIKVTKGYPSPDTYDHQINWFCAAPDPAEGLRSIIASKENPEAGLGILVLSNINHEPGAAEIFIKLLQSARGRGYGEDAVNTAVAYGLKELGLNLLCSHILESNTASQRLFEKYGFRRQKDLRNMWIYCGQSKRLKTG